MPIRQGTVFEGEVDRQDDLDTGYYVVLRSCKIGKGVGIWSHSVVDPGVVIGDNVRIQAHVYISSGTVIEDDVFIGPGTVFLNDKYPPRYDKDAWQPAAVRRGASIGGGVVVCPGVEIGEGAKIGAGAVVTKNVPAGEIWAGLPAHSLDPDRKKLLSALKQDVDEFKLDMLEASGYLVLMTHWMRGMLSMTGSKLQLSDVERDNWQRLIDNIEAYEEFTWQVAPPRAMLSQLRALRIAGYLDNDFGKLLDHDSHGRAGRGQAEVSEEVHNLIIELNRIARETWYAKQRGTTEES